MKKRVVISGFNIEAARQVRIFQVRLPREAKSVIGVGMGYQIIEGVDDPPPPPPLIPWRAQVEIRRNQLLGEIRLQSFEKANIFYTAELQLDKNLDFADFSSRHWAPSLHTHHTRHYTDVVNVLGESTVLQGIYKDKLFNFQEGLVYKYRVNVYVWVSTND
jgi:hypothetical protein